jgi:hypothetical protein
MITAKTAAGDTLRFDSFEEFSRDDVFPDTVFLEIPPGIVSDTFPELPPALQILVCKGAIKLRHFPNLPESITNVTLENCSVEDLPDLSAFRHLELLNLLGNCIPSLANPLPPGLRTLDVSFNKLREIRCEWPETLAHLDVTYNFLTTEPEDLPAMCQVEHHHNEYAWRPNVNGIRYPPNQHPTPNPSRRQVNVYKQGQNVHTSSVQASVNCSVKVIIEATAGKTMPFSAKNVANDTLEFLRGTHPTADKPKSKSRWWAFIDFVFQRFQPPQKGETEVPDDELEPHLREWCENRLVHSVHGVTFSFVLARVVHISKSHKDCDTLRTILKDELMQSIGMCFTGRFSRVINVLVGFVDGVEVGISSREQLQARMAHLSESDDAPHIKLRKAMEALTDFEFRDEWKAWVDAVAAGDEAAEDEERTGRVLEILNSTNLPKRPWIDALLTYDTNDDLFNIVRQHIQVTEEWYRVIFGDDVTFSYR